MTVPKRVQFGAAMAAAGLLAACGGGSDGPSTPTAAPSSAAPSDSPSATPSAEEEFFESFDNNDNDWPTRSDPDGTKLAITGGNYQVTLPAGSIRYIRPAALAQREDVRKNVSVTGKVRVLGGKKYAFGLACRMSPSDKQYYLGRLFEDGTSAIIRREKDKGERILRSSRANPIDLTAGEPVQLVVLCGEKDGKMTVTLTVNGKQAVTADDPQPLADNPPGIYAVAGLDTPNSAFSFDDILVSPYNP